MGIIGSSAVELQIENVPVPPPPELDPLALPDPLPEDDIEDPLDLLADDDPLVDEPLVEPDVEPLPDSDPEPEPLLELEPSLYGTGSNSRILP